MLYILAFLPLPRRLYVFIGINLCLFVSKQEYAKKMLNQIFFKKIGGKWHVMVMG